MSLPRPDTATATGATFLGRYRVMRGLASGGMGAVYLARNEGAAGFIKPVVIKRALRGGTGKADALFAREARILSSLRHPGIVGIVDFAEQDGDYIMVLDYVHGYTLAQWRRFAKRTRDGVAVELAVYVTLQVLDALEYAHSLRDPQGKPLDIVHRDIKPSNVLLDVQGHVKLADFGVARANTEATDTTTRDATLKGTFSYMAPELFSRSRPSPGSDVYAAAVTLYECIAGKNPFSARDAVQAAALTLRHSPPPLNEVRAQVPAELAQVVAKGMCKHPEGRYPTAEEFAIALRRAYPAADEAADGFREVMLADFNDPRFAELLGVDSLVAREAAWSRVGGNDAAAIELALPLSPSDFEPTSLQLALGDATVSPDEPATDPTEPPSLPGATRELTVQPGAMPHGPTRRTPRLPIALAVLGVTATIAAVALATTRSRSGPVPEPTVVMVRGDVTMESRDAATGPATDNDDRRDDEPTTAASAAGPAATPTEAGGREPEATPARRERTTPSTADALTARFRRRQPSIAACFESFPDDAAAAAGGLDVRFQVNTAGAVVAAELEPHEVGALPLGHCLLAVATATRFGALDEPLAFRIPIRARRRP